MEPLEVSKKQHHSADTSIVVLPRAQQSNLDDLECDVTNGTFHVFYNNTLSIHHVDEDDGDEDIEAVSSISDKSEQLDSHEQNNTDNHEEHLVSIRIRVASYIRLYRSYSYTVLLTVGLCRKEYLVNSENTYNIRILLWTQFYTVERM